ITVVSVHDVNVSAGEEVFIATVDDITLAQALEEMKSTKPKKKGVVIQELGECTTIISLQLSSQQSHYKGKGILIEPANIDVDHQLAERMQAQEQEEFSIKENATLFQQLLEKRRKHFAAKRAEEKRNKPPIKSQQRKIMCTYLKNMEGYKLKDLKLKEFDSIQDMFDKAFKRVNIFEDFRIELVEGKKKRAGTKLIQEIIKKQKVEDDKETTELKQLMKIIPDEDEVAIDAIPLAVNQMLKSFGREDLEDLYKLVKVKYESTRPVEYMDLLLWGDLKTMFKPHVEDKLKEFDLLKWDQHSCYTWVLFLRSKDEAPEEIKTFLKKITVLLQAPVIIVRTDNSTEFKNQVLQEYFNSVGISHQASSVRTPQQNEVVERRNLMLVEAARTLLIFSHAPLFLWAEAIATTCYTQNRTIIHRRFDKTPYEVINGSKLGGQTREKTIMKDQEHPEKCGETMTRAIIRAMVNKLPEESFSGVSEDKGDLEGIIDYLEPTLYDGFINPDDEAYKQRMNKFLGMPNTEPPLILKEEAEITRYNLGLEKFSQKLKS
ncbi:retrotransposon protein, putative, ty3-gypsy subclass, partial [Tanacetum coccineum]